MFKRAHRKILASLCFCGLAGALCWLPATVMAVDNELPPIPVPEGDTDGDGLTNKQEAYYGTKPNPPEGWDSDKDGISDGEDAIPTDPDFRFKRAPVSQYAVIDLGTAHETENESADAWMDPLGVSDNGNVLFRKYLGIGEDSPHAVDICVWKEGKITKVDHIDYDAGENRYALAINNKSKILYSGPILPQDPSLDSVPLGTSYIRRSTRQSPLSLNNQGDIVGWANKRLTGFSSSSKISYYHNVIDELNPSGSVHEYGYDDFDTDIPGTLSQWVGDDKLIYRNKPASATKYQITSTLKTNTTNLKYYRDSIYPAIWGGDGGAPRFLAVPRDRNDIIFTKSWKGDEDIGPWFSWGNDGGATPDGKTGNDADDAYNWQIDNTAGWDAFADNGPGDTICQLLINDKGVVAGSAVCPTASGDPNWTARDGDKRIQCPVVWFEAGKPGIILPSANRAPYSSDLINHNPTAINIRDMNNNNIILGTDTPNQTTNYGSALWLKVDDDWKRKDLEVLYPKKERKKITAYQINDQNEMLMGGWELWRNGEIFQLPEYMDSKKWVLWNVVSMSKTGMILAYAHLESDAAYARHAVLLIPVEFVDSKDATLDNGNDVMVLPKKEDNDKSSQTVAWIDPHGAPNEKDPEMPWLVLRVWGAEQMGLKIKWKLKVEYKRPNNRNLAEDKVTIPKTGDWVTEALDGAVEIYDNADWKTALQEKGFFGGGAELTFQLLKGDGSALGEESKWKFRIGGKNPDNTKARDYLTSSQADLWFAYAICKHETSEFRYGGTFYNQFVGNPKGKNLKYTKYSRTFPLAYGEPTWNWDYKDSKPGGFGLFQVTGWQGSGNGDVPRDVIWNWQRNMAEGANEIRRDKVPAATRYFNAVKSKYGQNISNPPASVTGKSRNLTGWEVSVIVRYNGVGGLDTHPELRPWLGRYTQDPWTYSGGGWSGPQPNSENYLRKVIPEIE